MKKSRMENISVVSLVALVLLVLLVMLGCGGKKEEGVKGNTPPEISEVTLLPLNPTIQSEISVRILSSDKEGDPITYKVKWFVNGKEIGEGMSFRYEEAKKGDEISAEVTPYDNKEWGKPVQTSEITIGGLAPKIISIRVIPDSVYITTRQVMLDAVVEDLDKDTVSLFCNWLVKDRVISDTQPTLNLQPFNLHKRDTIFASAFVRDREFRSDPFEFAIIISNSPPMLQVEKEITQLRPDSIYYPVPIIDPDGDQMTFEILEAPQGVMIDQKNGIIYGNAGDVKSFDVVVRATDSEGAYLDAKFTLTAP